MLHFAYGSNMDRAIMRKHAPSATPLGVASLKDYRFIITSDGYASAEPMRASSVYGVLWRLAPRDRVTLDRWECIASGQYRAETLQVLFAGSRRQAVIYIGRPPAAGRPKAGYMELVLAAARTWALPPAYVLTLREWLPAQPSGVGTRKLEEFASR